MSLRGEAPNGTAGPVAHPRPSRWPEIESRWRALDPVFIRGMQRSGTSIMARALQRLGILGFGEGHLWFEALKPMTRLLDPEWMPPLRLQPMALGEGRERVLAAHVALAIDDFHRSHLDPAISRWLDKSPGTDPITVAPALAATFPGAQFLFLHRNPISVVDSGLRKWGDDLQTFERLCREWRQTMRAWREARARLGGRALELSQHDLASAPRETARRLCAFLGQVPGEQAVFEVLARTRTLSSFPDRPPGSYGQAVGWSAAREARLVTLCSEEMAIWGYSADFERPSGPEPAAAIAAGARRDRSLRRHS